MPSDPPTSRWTVVGRYVYGPDGACLDCKLPPPAVDADDNALAARVAAALNGERHDRALGALAALRYVRDLDHGLREQAYQQVRAALLSNQHVTAEAVYQRVLDDVGMDIAIGVIEQVLDARAALVREQTEDATYGR